MTTIISYVALTNQTLFQRNIDPQIRAEITNDDRLSFRPLLFHFDVQNQSVTSKCFRLKIFIDFILLSLSWVLRLPFLLSFIFPLSGIGLSLDDDLLLIPENANYAYQKN